MSVQIPSVNSFIILTADGERLLAKYYDGRTKDDQTKKLYVPRNRISSQLFCPV